MDEETHTLDGTEDPTHWTENPTAFALTEYTYEAAPTSATSAQSDVIGPEVARGLIAIAVRERLDHFDGQVNLALTGFLAQAQSLEARFQVVFPSHESSDWSKFIAAALTLAVELMFPEEKVIQPIADLLPSGVKLAQLAKAAALKVQVPSHSAPTQGDDVTLAKQQIVEYANYLVHLTTETWQSFREPLGKNVDTLVSHYIATWNTVGGYDAGVQHAISNAIIADPSAHNITHLVHDSLVQDFAGVVARVQMETALGVPQLNRRLELLRNYLAYLSSHWATTLDVPPRYVSSSGEIHSPSLTSHRDFEIWDRNTSEWYHDALKEAGLDLGGYWFDNEWYPTYVKRIEKAQKDTELSLDFDEAAAKIGEVAARAAHPVQP